MNTTYKENFLSLKKYYLFYLIALTFSFSAPWPKTIGIPEVLSGIILTLLFGSYLIDYFLKKNFSLKKLILWYLLIFPLFLSFQWNTVDIIRDFIPLIYIIVGLVVPSYIIKLRSTNLIVNYYKAIVSFILFIGLIFSLKGYYEFITYGGNLLSLGSFHFFSPNYYPQSPAVIFAAVYLLLFSFWNLIYKKNILKFCILFILSLVIFGSIVGMVLRALIFLYFISGLVFLLVNIKVRQGFVYTFFIFILVFSLIYINQDIIISILNMVINKTLEHGTTGKVDEVFWAFDFIEKNFITLFFGTGWGGLWNAPSMGGRIFVSYAHSLLTYSIIKLGIVGLGIFILFIFYYLKITFFLLKKALKERKDSSFILIVFLACNSALIDNIFLEPGYKTLEFGVILLLYILTYKMLKKGIFPKGVFYE